MYDLYGEFLETCSDLEFSRITWTAVLKIDCRGVRVEAENGDLDQGGHCGTHEE